MSMHDQESIHYFGEKARYYDGSEEEKIRAKKYLEEWKYFFLLSLQNDCVSAEIIDEQDGIREPYICGSLAQHGWYTKKISVKIRYKFEISPLGTQRM